MLPKVHRHMLSICGEFGNTVYLNDFMGGYSYWHNPKNLNDINALIANVRDELEDFTGSKYEPLRWRVLSSKKDNIYE